MNIELRRIIFAMLPKKLKEMRYTYLKGKMSELSYKDEFLYDRRIMQQLNTGGHSQFGQDAFVWKLVFNCSNTGFFLDIGGNNPITINNTYLLEQNGWEGLAFEPMQSQSNLWKGQRTTECINMAIGDFDGEVEFTELSDHQFSGVSTSVNEDKQESHTCYKVKQMTLTNILKERNISKVDFVSIDVEGYEMNVLKGIDFDAIDITCFCIENNRDGDDRANAEIRNYLINRGYRLVARLTIDDLFIKNTYFKR